MKLEMAEKIVEHCGSENNDCNHCIANGKCGGGPWMYIEAMDVVIAARDARIADLEEDLKTMQEKAADYRMMNARSEKERDHARKDAVEMASRMLGNTVDELSRCRAKEIRDKYYK